jgi:hypothetical protein
MSKLNLPHGFNGSSGAGCLFGNHVTLIPELEK